MKLSRLMIASFLFLIASMQASYARDCHGGHGGGHHGYGGGHHYNNYNPYPSYGWGGHRRGHGRWHHRQPVVQHHYYGQPAPVVNNYPVYVQPQPQPYYIGNQGRIGVFFESGF